MQHSAVMPRLSVMMFLQFFVWGAWYVTVGNYMGAHNMEDVIGWAYTVGPIAAIISPIFLGLIADRFFNSEKVVGVLHVLGGLIMLAAPVFGEGSRASQSIFIGVLFLHMLCYMPTLSLTNSVAFHNLTDQEKQFPLVRVFGTIGWIVANFVVSKVFEADFKATQFYVTAGAGMALGVYCFTLPKTPPPAAGQKTTLTQALGLESLALLKQPSYTIFIISSLLICAPLAAYYAYAPVFVGDAGASNPAFNMLFGQVAEIFFMLVMPLCFAYLGVKTMLLAGMLAWVVRYGLFALGAPDAVWWMIWGGILLHGICYDFFFVTGFIYVDKKATKQIRAQAQSFLVVVTQGIGMLVGAQIAQALKNRIVTAESGSELLSQWQAFWIVPCIAAAVILVLFGLTFRDRADDDQKETRATPEL